MALPTNKQELADWILRRLGAPVINVEIADVQLEDTIDEAVQFFQEYHYDGVERTYRTIKISGDVLAGNNRKHQDVNAPMYDPVSREYRVGDRVMTYKTNGMPDKIWVKHDSEEFVIFRYYAEDSEGGIFFVFDSDLPSRDEVALVDPNAINHVDSDGVYVTYDSEIHSQTRYLNVTTEIVLYNAETDSDYKPDSDNYVVDSEGLIVPYDSDEHVIYKFDLDSEGNWVDSDGEWKPYDSDNDSNWLPTNYVELDSEANAVYFGPRFFESDGVFVPFDSDTHTTFSFTPDSDGDYVREGGVDRYVLWREVNDSDYLNSPKFKKIAERAKVYRPQLVNVPRYNRQFQFPTVYTLTVKPMFVDSDSEYVPYDSDKHFNYVLNDNGEFVLDSDSDYIAFDSDVHILKIVRDSEGSQVYDSDDDIYIPYDSDLHVTIVEEADSEGPWVRDSDGNLVSYDSDTHNPITYVLDSDGLWIDSDGTFRSWDSDIDSEAVPRYNRSSSLAFTRLKRTSIQPIRFEISNYKDIGYRIDSDNNTGRWVDSDGTFIPYDSDRYVTRAYQVVDSETRPGPDSELAGFFVDSDGGFVEYDSDKHSSIFYDSDTTGNKLTIKANLHRLFISVSILDAPQRYHVIYNTFPRYTRVWNVTRFHKETQLLGSRFSFNDVKQQRRTDYGFADFWKEEDLVLTEPVLDYDYSKAGQVGIPIPDTIIGINKIFRIDNFSGMGMWNYEYQYFLNNFDYFYGNGGASVMPMTNYMITKMNIDFIDHMMNVQPAIRFNKARNKLYIDTNWTRLKNSSTTEDHYLLAEVYEVNDPEVYGDVYKNSWLKRYATALAKMQWGSNLKKYQNTELPGGIVLSGQELYDEGKEESEKLEEELKNTGLEMDFLMG